MHFVEEVVRVVVVRALVIQAQRRRKRNRWFTLRTPKVNDTSQLVYGQIWNATRPVSFAVVSACDPAGDEPLVNVGG
jgi:hypothetical protein